MLQRRTYEASQEDQPNTLAVDTIKRQLPVVLIVGCPLYRQGPAAKRSVHSEVLNKPG